MVKEGLLSDSEDYLPTITFREIADGDTLFPRAVTYKTNCLNKHVYFRQNLSGIGGYFFSV